MKEVIEIEAGQIKEFGLRTPRGEFVLRLYEDRAVVWNKSGESGVRFPGAGPVAPAYQPAAPVSWRAGLVWEAEEDHANPGPEHEHTWAREPQRGAGAYPYAPARHACFGCGAVEWR